MDVHHLPWIFILGIIGNAFVFLVSIAPMPTFYQIYKKKTSAGFQSVPYLAIIISSMLWIYYALLKKNLMLLLITNAVRSVTQIFFIGIYIYYASKKDKVVTVSLFLLINVLGFGTIVVSTFFLKNPMIRLRVVGYICLAFAWIMFAAPLCIMRQVIKTKSVEYMPFTLSVFLTLSALMWFLYGFLYKDMIIAVPNGLGIIFGMLQMIIYAIYRKHSKKMVEEAKLYQLSKQNTSNINRGVHNSIKV